MSNSLIQHQIQHIQTLLFHVQQQAMRPQQNAMVNNALLSTLSSVTLQLNSLLLQQQQPWGYPQWQPQQPWNPYPQQYPQQTYAGQANGVGGNMTPNAPPYHGEVFKTKEAPNTNINDIILDVDEKHGRLLFKGKGQMNVLEYNAYSQDEVDVVYNALISANIFHHEPSATFKKVFRFTGKEYAFAITNAGRVCSTNLGDVINVDETYNLPLIEEKHSPIQLSIDGGQQFIRLSQSPHLDNRLNCANVSDMKHLANFLKDRLETNDQINEYAEIFVFQGEHNPEVYSVGKTQTGELFTIPEQLIPSGDDVYILPVVEK